MTEEKYQVLLVKYGEIIPNTSLKFRDLSTAKKTATYLNSLLSPNLLAYEHYVVAEICRTEPIDYDKFKRKGRYYY